MKWLCPTHGPIDEQYLERRKIRVIKMKIPSREYWEISLNCPNCGQEVHKIEASPTE